MIELVKNLEDGRLYVVIDEAKEFYLPLAVMYELNQYELTEQDIVDVINFKRKGEKYHIVTVKVVENQKPVEVNILTTLDSLVRTDKFDMDYIKLLKEHSWF